MALTPCVECGKPVSSDAPACPACGKPVPPQGAAAVEAAGWNAMKVGCMLTLLSPFIFAAVVFAGTVIAKMVGL